jgi:drug/metabolite transporter (DMT)-like permease
VEVPDRKKYAVDALLVTAITIWGFNYAVMKGLFRYFHPIAFNAVRFVISSTAMLLVLKVRREPLRIAREDIPRVLWLGFLANAVYQFFFSLGLARTRAGNSALLMALSPVFAFLIGVAMKREHFSPGVLTGIILSLAGVVAIVVFGGESISFGDSWRGDLMMIGASVIWGWQSAESTRLLGKYGPIRLTVATMIAGTAFMVPLSIPWIIDQRWSGIEPIAWLGLAFSALLSIAYSYFVWAYALSTIGVAHTSVFNNVTPIIALFAGWLLLGEHPSPSQLAGVVLVLIGVFMVRSRKPIAMLDD